MTKTTVTAFYFEPCSFVPNNPRLPALIYEGTFAADAPDLAELMEKRFQENGWPPQWRNGIYDFDHYHPQGHEVLGIAAGSAKLLLPLRAGHDMPLNASSMLAQLLNAPMRPGRLVWLGIRPRRREPMLALKSADFDIAHGVVGDRYARVPGSRQVKLIEVEHLAAIISHTGRSEVLPADLRRNVVTRGINLPALKNKHSQIGSAVLETTGECHPVPEWKQSSVATMLLGALAASRHALSRAEWSVSAINSSRCCGEERISDDRLTTDPFLPNSRRDHGAIFRPGC